MCINKFTQMRLLDTPTAGCFKDGYGIGGGDVGYIRNVASAYDCQVNCERKASCQAWEWKKENGDCSLKSKPLSQFKHYNFGPRIAGPKFCAGKSLIG